MLNLSRTLAVKASDLALAAWATATLATCGFLLFALEPMTGRMVVPLAGGTPAAWNTCLFFFQGCVLLGALYAHGSSRFLSPRNQAVFHAAFLLAAFALLPIRIEADVASTEWQNSPATSLLRMLIVGAALPTVAITATTPLVQGWVARVGTRFVDPFALFAASNSGSLVALAAYPLWIERRLGIAAQSAAWGGLYAVLVILGAGGFIVVSRARVPNGRIRDATLEPADRPSVGSPLRWVVLAAIPSSLVSSVTAYLSADVAAAPLLWAIPLGLYLATWIVAFGISPDGILHPERSRRAAALLIAPLLVAIATEASEPAAVVISLHLAVFFLAALACHQELAKCRPAAGRIEEYYLWIAVGGALGGLVNALLAPHVFSAVTEYPFGLVAACALRTKDAEPGENWRSDLFHAGTLVCLTLSLAAGAWALGIPPGRGRTLVVFLPPTMLAYSSVREPRRLALSFAAVLLAAGFGTGAHGDVIAQERTFFGVTRVTHTEPNRVHVLVHGRTIHGRQSLAVGDRRQPLSYYHRDGPYGALMAARSAENPPIRVAAIGLGAGATAAYARPKSEWTFYEIDPVMIRFASDPALFTYLRDSPAERVRIVVGDARLRRAEAPDRTFDVVVLDAFGSDAMPGDLLTREARALYRRKLARRGWIIVHVSSRLLDLEPLVARLARDAGLAARIRDDAALTAGDLASGRDPSRWAVLAERTIDLGSIARDALWRAPRAGIDAPLWTDDFSSLWGLFRWQTEGDAQG